MRFCEGKPSGLPLTFSQIDVVFGKIVPDVEGYSPEDVIYEVLQDVGVVIEPDGLDVEPRRESLG